MTDHLAAEIGVRRLHALCADAVWRRDPDAFSQCYTEDGEWKIVGLHVRGREAIGQTLTELGSGNTHVLMNFASRGLCALECRSVHHAAGSIVIGIRPVKQTGIVEDH